MLMYCEYHIMQRHEMNYAVDVTIHLANMT